MIKVNTTIMINMLIMMMSNMIPQTSTTSITTTNITMIDMTGTGNIIWVIIRPSDFL